MSLCFRILCPNYQLKSTPSSKLCLDRQLDSVMATSNLISPFIEKMVERLQE